MTQEKEIARLISELEDLRGRLVKETTSGEALRNKVKALTLEAETATQSAAEERIKRAEAEAERSTARKEAAQARKEADAAYSVAVNVEREKYQASLQEIYKLAGDLIEG